MYILKIGIFFYITIMKLSNSKISINTISNIFHISPVVPVMAGERGRGELVQDSIQNNTFYLVVKPLVSFSREQLFSLSLRNVKGVKNIDYLCI